MKATSKKVTAMEKEHTRTRMETNMLVNSKQTRCMEKEHISLAMETSLKVQ